LRDIRAASRTGDADLQNGGSNATGGERIPEQAARTGYVLETPGAGAGSADNAGMDAERAARIGKIEGLPAEVYTPKAVDKKTAEKLFKGFAPVTKQFTADFFESQDTRKKPRNAVEKDNTAKKVALNVTFPAATVGKLRGVFSVRNDNIIADIRKLFDGSEYAYSSNYIIQKTRPDGSAHKEHSNIEAYHHFVNKITVNGSPSYIRFVVEELKTKGQLHSAHITKVEILHKKSRDSDRSLLENDPGGTAQPAYDYNLAEFLNSVKNKDFGPETSPENDSDLLFQLTRAEEVEEARESVRRGRSHEEFIGDWLESGEKVQNICSGFDSNCRNDSKQRFVSNCRSS
jgi:hypothetical protein